MGTLELSRLCGCHHGDLRMPDDPIEGEEYKLLCHNCKGYQVMVYNGYVKDDEGNNMFRQWLRRKNG